MNIKRMIKTAIALGMAFLTSMPAYADIGKVRPQGIKEKDNLQVVMESDYLEGKVNDPVTRKTKAANIVCDNACFHLEGDPAGALTATVVFYINEYIDGHDIGVKNRVLKKKVKMGESMTMIPEDVYERDSANGSAFDFINRCYSVRIQPDIVGAPHQDIYFGLVDESVFQMMSENIQAEIDAKEDALEELTEGAGNGE